MLASFVLSRSSNLGTLYAYTSPYLSYIFFIFFVDTIASGAMLSPMQTLFHLSNTGGAGVCAYRKNPMTLEKKIENLIREATENTSVRFDVVAHELWGNTREGYSTNSSWYIAKDADLQETLEAARGRWEVFKLNYHSKARVCDISDTGFDSTLSLEVDCVPFLEIRVSK